MSPLSLFLIWHRLPPSDIRAPASWTFGLRQVFITSFPGSQLLEGAWWVCLASVFVGQFPQGISSGTYTRLHPLYPAAYTRLRPPYLLHIYVYVLGICRVYTSASSASAAYTHLRPPYLPRIHVYILGTDLLSHLPCPLQPPPSSPDMRKVLTCCDGTNHELKEHQPLWGDSVCPASRQRTPCTSKLITGTNT